VKAPPTEASGIILSRNRAPNGASPWSAPGREEGGNESPDLAGKSFGSALGFNGLPNCTKAELGSISAEFGYKVRLMIDCDTDGSESRI
jgi:hypothetical protein